MKSSADSGKAVQILLVDDHPVVRDGLADAIKREPDLQVCGMAEDRAGAFRLTETASPDLVVVDLLLKNSSGLELIKDLHVSWPKLLILVVSMQEEKVFAERALRAGARGYITKQRATRDIIAAIRRILGGEIYLSDTIASAVISRLTTNPQALSDSITDSLTDRELQVFELTGIGLSTREVAERLRVDVKTVETYRARLKEKLNLKDGTELLKLAIRWNKERSPASELPRPNQ
jgi:DNA-binding NarL/FixJ family response regulator